MLNIDERRERERRFGHDAGRPLCVDALPEHVGIGRFRLLSPWHREFVSHENPERLAPLGLGLEEHHRELTPRRERRVRRRDVQRPGLVGFVQFLRLTGLRIDVLEPPAPNHLALLVIVDLAAARLALVVRGLADFLQIPFATVLAVIEPNAMEVQELVVIALGAWHEPPREIGQPRRDPRRMQIARRRRSEHALFVVLEPARALLHVLQRIADVRDARRPERHLVTEHVPTRPRSELDARRGPREVHQHPAK